MEVFGFARTQNANGGLAEGEPEQISMSEVAKGELCFTKSLLYSHALREPLKGLTYKGEGEERCHHQITLPLWRLESGVGGLRDRETAGSETK